MHVGAITFGPTKSAEEIRAWQSNQNQMQSWSSVNETVQSCNCMGPQAGERLCPCALRAETTMAEQMLRDGVVICGQKYRLVPVS